MTRLSDPIWDAALVDIFRSEVALDFDGVDDLVNAGSDTSIDNIFDSGGSAFIWADLRSVGGGGFGRLFDKTQWRFFVSGESAGFVKVAFDHLFSGDDLTHITTARPIALGQFVHVGVTYDNGDVSNVPILYIDGIATTFPQTSLPTGTRDSDASADLIIGNSVAASRASDGVLDDPFLVNRILTVSEVLEAYNGGSPPDLSQLSFWNGSDVVLWHQYDKDVFPLVLDHTDPTFGADLVDAGAGTFEGSGTFAWTAFGSNTIANVSNALEITYVTDNRGAKGLFRDASDLSSDLTVGVLYKVQFTASINSGLATIIIHDDSNQLATTANLTTSPTAYTLFFIATTTTTCQLRTAGFGSSEVITLDNWSVQEANANHGIMTNMAASDFVAGVDG